MKETFDNEVIKAVNCLIDLGEAVIDAYMLPDGEKRIGVENTGIILGYSEGFFYQRTQRESKALKVLRNKGFSGKQIWVKIIRQGNDKRDSFLSRTVSLRDFTKLVAYEATAKHNPKAIVLLAVFAETGLERILEDAFAGRSVDFLLEKIVHYTKWTYQEREEVLAYNREEVRALNAWSKAPSLDDR